MKLIDLFEQHPELTPEQIKWLDKVVIGTWEYKNGVVDVEGAVNATGERLTKIPVQFGYVSGYFFAFSINLTSLKGAPREVGGPFAVYNNNLTSIEGAPKEVAGIFDACGNNLTSLTGAPREVGEDFWVNNNKLTSLKGSPKEVGGDFRVINNKLTSLEGSPKEVGGNFYCNGNTFKTEPDHSFIKIGGKFVWK